MAKLRVGVLASGGGTNLQSIIDASEKGEIEAEVVVVISDKKDAFALERARKNGIKAVFVDPKLYSSRELHENAIVKILEENKAGLVCLAGYMRLLTDHLIGKFENKIINIHPALLPSFSGTHGQKDALDYGVKVAGCTVHFVVLEMDAGPIIAQAAVPVLEGDTAETLSKRILEQEHKLYPKAIDLFAKGKLKIKGRRVKIND
ncbi:MAG: phosphoribosylglycinamide formyltransferase [Candidatus Firestonebacteria bacterium RIFOXYC2_FULL_39_67]|nr:MAG: phosphoribosylglycinamide formyltransferase [Candidatus Firestonebacteria bacterium RIFOXYD2_FULL_39_29]OGF56170.1 MAG: phosphoribosylglycinamide formyltransferase [Candidatus Firestonebacteria bacterium RIFOXYC2_FULL_39_67]